jgi:hypothetical protein
LYNWHPQGYEKFQINPASALAKIELKQEKLSGKRFLSSHVYWHSAKHININLSLN